MRQGQADVTKIQHNDHSNQYNDNVSYYDNQPKSCVMNSMGDIDRQTNVPQNREFNQHLAVWANPVPYFGENQNKSYRNYDNDQSKVSSFDYTGHRPPASDHYGGNLGSTNDNSKTFSRSVNDTVDIVRKRLERRGSHYASDNDNPPVDQSEEKVRETTSSSYSNVHSQPEQTTKKKINRTRNMKSNCDKIKSKIVHQLFKMDKDKIHKFMDNPNSSHKFEYAISSLITESQNSYNRHLRSVAEKSLSSTSSEFIHNYNNTIYEDTFMKQMQCLLDPQDTVLLEDLKPIVLAELSKVLQLDDFEHRQEYDEQQNCYSAMGEQSQYSQYPSHVNYENYQNEPYPPDDQSSYYDQKPSLLECPTTDTPYTIDNHKDYCDESDDSKSLFERRSRSHSHSRRSSSGAKHRNERRSTDSKSNEDQYRRSGTPITDEYKRINTSAANEYEICGSSLSTNNVHKRNLLSVPLFEPNVEQVSEEEDPFAELDNQYHVAVDPNFIDNDDIPISLTPPITITSAIGKNEIPATMHSSEKSKSPVETPCTGYNAFHIKKEIDTHEHDLTKSSLKLTNRCEESRKLKEAIHQEPAINSRTNSKQMVVDLKDKFDKKNETSFDLKPDERSADKLKISTSMKSSAQSRKRSIEENPYRKEKRKKSDSEQTNSETNKQIVNKNIIINVNDCAAKSTTKNSDTPKSIFNLFFSKEKTCSMSSKENKKLDTSEKISDKHNKRKDEKNSTKSKDKETGRRKHDSSSSNHSTLSPAETSVSKTVSQTPTKADSKLKTIDMFIDHPKKNSVHQAHRNTAPVPIASTTVVETIRPPILPANRTIAKKHVSTQVIRKAVHKEVQTTKSKISTSRFCQTERKKLMTRGTQSEPVSIRYTSNTTDNFERMKEIDMEIQTLLQEKFKLYSSLESREGYPTNTMQSLGMAVLNVAPLNDSEDDAAENAIVEDFTSIPVEELEQIAFETVQEDKSHGAQERRSLRQKVAELQRKSSLSPASTGSAKYTRRKRKIKSPNISLIEQIITDDRPLEDIISLDDLESLPLLKTKPLKQKKAKSKLKPNKKEPKNIVVSTKTKLKKNAYAIKECSVVLVREDLDNKIKSFEVKDLSTICEADETVIVIESETELVSKTIEIVKDQENEVEETVGSDIQFDMLDVSEDIVIGDNCEVKSSEKDGHDSSAGSISEEIILDNSQSEIDDTARVVTEDKSRECIVYDYALDENFRRDSITVSGHADAVLAIEVSSMISHCKKSFFTNCVLVIILGLQKNTN